MMDLYLIYITISDPHESRESAAGDETRGPRYPIGPYVFEAGALLFFCHFMFGHDQYMFCLLSLHVWVDCEECPGDPKRPQGMLMVLGQTESPKKELPSLPHELFHPHLFLCFQAFCS